MTTVRPPNEYEKSLLKRKGYTIIEPAISSGSFAAVFRARRNGQKIAVKLIDCGSTSISDNYRYKFLPRELYVLTKLKHPFITLIYDIFTITNRIYIFMELAAGDVIDMLKNGPLTESKCKILYKQVCSALHYMHSLGIAHRDLKCENILINESRTVAKITDFGFARKVYDQNTGRKIMTETHCGSAAYVAPEVLLSEIPFDAIRADCWSIGVVLFVLVNNRLPFSTKSGSRQYRKQMKKEYSFNRPLSRECMDLIANLLEPDIKSRYTMSQVLNHPWLIHVKLEIPSSA